MKAEKNLGEWQRRIDKPPERARISLRTNIADPIEELNMTTSQPNCSVQPEDVGRGVE
jgi:hypothetical protein